MDATELFGQLIAIDEWRPAAAAPVGRRRPVSPLAAPTARPRPPGPQQRVAVVARRLGLAVERGDAAAVDRGQAALAGLRRRP